MTFDHARSRAMLRELAELGLSVARSLSDQARENVLGVALAHVMRRGQLAGLPYLGQPFVLFLGGQRLFQLVVPVEVVFDGVLATAGNEEHVIQAGRHGFLHDVLDGRLVDDRQHFLGRRLGRRQEPGAQPGRGNHGLGHISHAKNTSESPGRPRP